MTTFNLEDQMRRTMAQRKLADAESAVLLMVSGGSDSTALAYAAASLRDAGELGPLAMLHVNHQLRGADADSDQDFVVQLADLLHIPLFICAIDIAGEAKRTGENVEAVGRQQRYLAANEALESMCLHEGVPFANGRIFTAHTVNDRMENFYMRSIVGTGPGGFRSMLYRNGPVVRPLLDAERDQLRDYIRQRNDAGQPVACDSEGNLWREDATNAHTDQFRAYVRHEIIPKAKERNAQLASTLRRTMNLIAEEDDMLEEMAQQLVSDHVEWLQQAEGRTPDFSEGCVLLPAFAQAKKPLQRRAAVNVLQSILGVDARVETASVEAVLAGFENGLPNSGYVTNVQGNLAVSANKRGVRIEPMDVFRARRKRS